MVASYLKGCKGLRHLEDGVPSSKIMQLKLLAKTCRIKLKRKKIPILRLWAEIRAESMSQSLWLSGGQSGPEADRQRNDYSNRG